MPLKTEPLEEPNFNLISLLDVVLTIVMFFMVSTTFSQNERQTEIQVPTVSDSAVLTGQPDEIVINVAILSPDALTATTGLINISGECSSGAALSLSGDIDTYRLTADFDRTLQIALDAVAGSFVDPVVAVRVLAEDGSVRVQLLRRADKVDLSRILADCAHLEVGLERAR